MGRQGWRRGTGQAELAEKVLRERAKLDWHAVAWGIFVPLKTIAAAQMPSGQLDNLMSVADKVGHCMAERLEAAHIEALYVSNAGQFLVGGFLDGACSESKDCNQLFQELDAIVRSEVAKFRLSLSEVGFGAKSCDGPLLEVACHMSQEVGDTVLCWTGSLAELLIAQLRQAVVQLSDGFRK